MGVGVSLASLVTTLSSFPGFLVSVDLTVPVLIPFPFVPERYDDDFSAEFEYVSSPGSRYQYPVFKGNSPRIVNFTAKFDQLYPNAEGRIARETLRAKIAALGNNLGTDIVLADEIANVISMFEKLKLPKQGIQTTVQSALGNFLKVGPGQADPCPPLVLLVENPFKMYVGYLSNAKITKLRHNTLMMPTRISVACRLLVTPDLIFTTLEDAIREVNVLKGWHTL